ncbi:elongation factor Ts [Methylohalomonas lacus]|uniref:Elongation factor Ts n=1 Tax=Methylohalomonas lacus TaxID=398773 RepID=A0AAE3HLB1_9GAMM|nr:translation elongation factor Ts [Methylohalomonas lacus]MCS3902518.1 elongation factor Ts [Methylohalomonas lacus]
MDISAAQVKELRERTGAGMMDCKKALVEAGGDIEAAIEAMRKSGVAKAAKKAGRVAAEGGIIIKTNDAGDQAVILEVNSETDFVANDANFQSFAQSVADTVLAEQPADVDALNGLTLAGGSETVEEARQQLILKIGENISVRRFVLHLRAGDHLASYLHGSRIGVLVDLEGGSEELARDMAMHIAASNPACVSEDQIPAEMLEQEKAVFVSQAKESGKPDDIIEKMVSGRIAKYKKEITLEGQPFVKDPDQSAGEMLKAAKARVNTFIRYEVGEGIEKKVDDFASEVMAQARG